MLCEMLQIQCAVCITQIISIVDPCNLCKGTATRDMWHNPCNYFQTHVTNEHYLLSNIEGYCSESIINKCTVIKITNHTVCAEYIGCPKKMCLPLTLYFEAVPCAMSRILVFPVSPNLYNLSAFLT